MSQQPGHDNLHRFWCKMFWLYFEFTPFLDGKITWLEQNICGCKRMNHFLDGKITWIEQNTYVGAREWITPRIVSDLYLVGQGLVDLWWHVNSFLEWLWQIYLCFGCWFIVTIFNHHNLAEISVPSKEKIKEYKGVIHAKNSHLENVWCARDGLTLYFKQSSSTKVQEQY